MTAADVLVVGGGIAGIEAALAVANAGRTVCLVERQPTLGGHVAALGRVFPTLERAAPLLVERMEAARAHPRIAVRTCSDVTRVGGGTGRYDVDITRRPRYVREDRCTSCLECVDACVYDARFPDEFNEGLGWRKPIYLPFPAATPRAVVIDPVTCSGLSPLGCDRPCVAACGDRRAIDLAEPQTTERLSIAAIVLATGFRTFDVARASCYGYGTYPNVYTSLEVERLLGRAPETPLTLRDGRTPRAIAIVHCVGSRWVSLNRWCSRVCCMSSLKLAHLLHERTGAEVFDFYVDMRTPGAAFEEFYQQRLTEGVQCIRGRVAEVTDWALDGSEEGRLVIRVEDTLLGVIRRVPVDMVVLSAGLEPQADAPGLGRLFNIPCSPDGFFVDPHSAFADATADKPADHSEDYALRATDCGTWSSGIFVAGCCEGPKDIRESVDQALAAAARILVRLAASSTCPVSR